MNRSEKELLLRMEKVELENLKVILNIKQQTNTITQSEIDYLLEKISTSLRKIETLEESLKT